MLAIEIILSSEKYGSLEGWIDCTREKLEKLLEPENEWRNTKNKDPPNDIKGYQKRGCQELGWSHEIAFRQRASCNSMRFIEVPVKL